MIAYLDFIFIFNFLEKVSLQKEKLKTSIRHFQNKKFKENKKGKKNFMRSLI